MQRGVVLGAAAVVLIAGGVLALRAVSGRQAGRMLDQNMDQILSQLPPGYAVRHGATDYDPLTGTLSVHDVAVTYAGHGGWTARLVTVSGADWAALQATFDPAAYPGGKPAWTDRRLLITDASARDLHATTTGTDPTDITVAKMTLHRLSGHPFAAPPTPEARATPAFAAEAALDFAFGSAALTDTVVADHAANPTRTAIASVTIDGYDGGKVQAAAVRAVTLDAGMGRKKGNVHGGIDSMKLTNADAAALLQAKAGQPSSAVPRFTYGAADLAGLTLQVPQGPTLALHDLHAVEGETGADHHGKVSMTGLTLALAATPLPVAAASSVAAFGLNALTLDVTATSKGRLPGVLDLHEDVVIHDLGTLRIDGAVEGYVQPQMTSSDPAVAMGALAKATLDRASLVWEDASLVDRALRVAAQKDGVTPDQVRGQLAMPIIALGSLVPDQPDAAEQVTAFVTHPHRLTLTMQPPSKLTFGALAAAPVAARAHMLGLHVSSN